ncbi:NEDD8 activating enzyme protein [Lasiodiplodia theobromae]|uniref:NEDD8 activating enzyme protein n=1 Tax=Lasiodiplodia theobromae TaxID=45133 RepID=UPI0015C34D13|nr:NEDD8 activating enzyme protein [Lasiodiplodia theobromae]KAF4545229.1 NEDD8 activating enzyme protein [Lasiodiplodia theobromae]
MAMMGPLVQAITGGYFDLISFDPRSAGKTIAMSCYRNSAERVNATLMNPNFNGHESDTMLGRLWASTENLDAACYENNKEIGDLVGMSFTARDYIRIAETLNEDGLLRYFGFSGGTVLGATIAAMFPDKIERMILDGVWNIHEYWHYQTADDLEKATYELIEKVKYRPLPYQGKLIDYTFVRNVIFLGITSVAQWPAVATFLDALFTGNMAELDAPLQTLSATEDPVFTENRFGIQCGDKPWRTSHLEDVLPIIDQVSSLSKLAGDRISYDIEACVQWKMNAKERYLGDYRVSTRHPILIIGNTFDPVTPIVSARNASASLEGSVVLEHHGFGVCLLLSSGLPFDTGADDR